MVTLNHFTHDAVNGTCLIGAICLNLKLENKITQEEYDKIKAAIARVNGAIDAFYDDHKGILNKQFYINQNNLEK